MFLESLDDIVYGQTYYFCKNCFGEPVATVVFTRRESEFLVAGIINEEEYPVDIVDGPVYILAEEIGKWRLSDDPAEAARWVDVHTRTNRLTVRREQRSLQHRLPGSSAAVAFLKKRPELVAWIKTELERFKNCADKSLFACYTGEPRQVFGFQSLPSYWPNCHDYQVTDAAGRHYALQFCTGFRNQYLPGISVKHGDEPWWLSLDTVAWGPVLEWVDRLPSTALIVKEESYGASEA